MKWFSPRHGSIRLTLAVLMNILLLCFYRWIALESSNLQKDMLRRLFVGLLATATLAAAWHVVRYGRERERIMGVVLLVLPSLFLLAIMLWAAFQW